MATQANCPALGECPPTLAVPWQARAPRNTGGQGKRTHQQACFLPSLLKLGWVSQDGCKGSTTAGGSGRLHSAHIGSVRPRQWTVRQRPGQPPIQYPNQGCRTWCGWQAAGGRRFAVPVQSRPGKGRGNQPSTNTSHTSTHHAHTHAQPPTKPTGFHRRTGPLLGVGTTLVRKRKLSDLQWWVRGGECVPREGRPVVQRLRWVWAGAASRKKKGAGEMGAFVGHSLGLPWARRRPHAPRASQGPQARQTPA